MKTKLFTEPAGRFTFEVPSEWQYANAALRIKEASPFSFEYYPKKIGLFQLFFHSNQEVQFIPNGPIQKYGKQNLNYLKGMQKKDDRNDHTWYAFIEDYIVLATYIYDTKNENNSEILDELKKVEHSLSTLQLISPELRISAIQQDRYSKFMGSLGALLQLKNIAMGNKSFVEILILVANEIDSYLRLAIVMKKQLQEKTHLIDLTYLYQAEEDIPINERKIYKTAKDLEIITPATFEKLEELYKERNRVVHRYVITDLKTVHLYNIVLEFMTICKTVKQSLVAIERMQFESKIGIHANSPDPDLPMSEDLKNHWISLVDEKHLDKELINDIQSKIFKD